MPTWVEERRLLTYANADESETIWNSRPGAVPKFVRSQQTNEKLLLVDQGVPAPEYVPAVGERVIVDMTEQRARIISTEALERAERERPEQLHAEFSGPDQFITISLAALLNPPAPDVITVTSGFIEELQEFRKNGVPRDIVDAEPSSSARDELPIHFDRQGNPIDVMTWARLLEDKTYKIIESTQIDEDTFVSTIWLGLDHGFGRSEKPVIFESMVFRRLAKPVKRLSGRGEHTHDEAGQDRYCTEEEARAGHARMVAAVSAENERRKQLKVERAAKKDDTSFRSWEQKGNCWSCGFEFEVQNALDGGQPMRGDMTVCINCGSVGCFTDTMAVRQLTEAEYKTLPKRVLKVSQRLKEAAAKRH